MKKLLAALLIIMFAVVANAADWALTDPGADRLVGWDDSATGAEVTWWTIGTGLSINGTTISVGDLSGTYQPLNSALTSLAGLTEADVSIAEMTGADAYAVVTSGGANRLLGSNSDNSALEFKSSLTGLTFGGFSTTAGIAVTSDGSGNLTQSFTNLLPDAADGAALGSAAAEWSDIYLADGGVIYFQNDQSVYLTSSAGTLALTGALVTSGAISPSSAGGAALGSATAEWDHLYLHDAAVIYGQADQSNTLTSSATGWTANLNFVVTGQLSGRVPVVADADGKTLSGTDLYGSMQLATGAGTWTIPDVDATAGTGQSFCIYVTGAYEVVIAGDAEDKIRLAGTLGAAGGDITNNTAEAAGDFICLMLTDFASDVAHWTTLGYKGTWTVVP